MFNDYESFNDYKLYLDTLKYHIYNILIFVRPENGGKICSGGDQKYKSCSTEQVTFTIF